MSERVLSLVMALMVKPGLVIGLAVVLSSLLGRQSASARHRVLAAAFLVALALPAFRAAVPTLPLRLLAATSTPAQRAPAVQSPSDGPTLTERGRSRAANDGLLDQRPFRL